MSDRAFTAALYGIPAPSAFDALVLAGSFGWGQLHARGLPPRPLAPIALRPLITFTLEWLIGNGAAAVTICAQGSCDLLHARLGDRYAGSALQYAQDQMPRGPAGCIKDAAPPSSSHPIVVAEGTLLPTLDLYDLLDAHRLSGAAMTVVATREPRAGLLRPAGVYVVERRALAFVSASGFQDIKEMLIPRLHRAGERVHVHCPPDAGPRVGNLETYLRANHWAIRQLARAAGAPSSRSRQGVLTAHPSACIADAAVLVGDIVIGAGAYLESGATVIGPAVIGGRARVSSGAMVARSVVGDGCGIAAGALVHSGIVADGVQLEAGARVYRSVRLRPETAATGWRRFWPARRAAPIEQPIGVVDVEPGTWLPPPVPFGVAAAVGAPATDRGAST